MNKELLTKVRDKIEERPEQFIMGWWYGYQNESGGKPSHCGTAACIAGWTVVLGGQVATPKDLPSFREGIHATARELLRLDAGQAMALFGRGWWPEPFRTQFRDAATQAEKVRVAVDRINHFLTYEN